MRSLHFRAKLFLVPLLLVMAGTDLLGAFFLWQVKNLVLEREAASASLEAAVIASQIADDFKDALLWNPDLTMQSCQNTLHYYQRFYREQGVSLSLVQQLPAKPSIQDKTLSICQPLPEPFNLWALAYQRDLSPCYSMLDRCMEYFCRISAGVMLCMLGALAFFIHRSTRPLSELLCATRKIARGEYDVTLSGQRGDEFGELARHFSAMSAAIQNQLAETKQLAADQQRLVDQLAHELRTPLTSICGFSELLLCGGCTDEERTVALNHIHQQSTRMKALSLRLLEQEKIAPQTLCREWFPASDFIEELKAAWAGIESRTGVSVTAAQEGERLYGDRLWLQNLLLNLVENAARASAPGDVVRVTVRAADDGTFLEVCDQGCGIAEDDLPKLFEPFFRADRAKARAENGNGLGLTLCRTIAQAHGGRIEADSRVGEGSRFSVFLPLDNKSATTS